MSVINILGINISALNKVDILKKIELFLKDGRQHQIVTPNPEFLIEAEKDEEFFYILNAADLAVPDGIGLKFAARLMGKRLDRIAGADLVYDICAIAERKGKSIYLIGGEKGIAQKAAENLKKKFPDLKIVGAEEGLKHGEWKIKAGEWIKGEDKDEELIKRIDSARPDIIFSAFGHPRQDKWIFHDLRKTPSVKIGMGVGGTFDFIAGKVKRAPKIFRFFGMEWAWRLILEPWRWKRILDATVIFPYRFIMWRFVYPLFYRPNVACVLYKKENGKFKILLVKRAGYEEHWQVPQGGTDHENIEKAGLRELREELCTTKFKPVRAIKNVYKYKFRDKKEMGKYESRAMRILGYKGQKQGLFIAEFAGTDSDIKINYWDHSGWKWIDSEKLVEEVHPVRRHSAKIFLEKFRESVEKNG